MSSFSFAPQQNIGGLASGLDTNSILSQLMAIEQQPLDRLAQRQSLETARKSTLSQVQTLLAGVKSAMLMQNHGFLASINGIVSCAQLYHIPLLMLISYRGEFGERDPWQTEGGGVTEDLLRALRIPFSYLDRPDHVAPRIAKAQTLALSANKPVALLLCRDLMWEDA